MNYEKEYWSIVEKLKNALLCIYPDGIKKTIEDILHESNESEDERIRKWLYDYMSNCPNNNFAFYGGVGKDAVLNYLEKQKEQDTYKSSKSEIDFADRYSKDVWENLMSKFNAVEGYSIGCNDVSDIVLNAILNAFKWQKEQNPIELPKSEDYGIDGLYAAVDILQKTLGEVDGYQTDDGILEHKCAISAVKELYGLKPAEWSEEDENAFKYLHKLIEFGYSKNFTGAQTAADMRKWVNKSFRPQPKQEWSEEDEKMRDAAIDFVKQNKSFDFILGIDKDFVIDWLKSLRPSWKPSEVQMATLSWFCNGVVDGVCAPDLREELRSLYNDLKKL